MSCTGKSHLTRRLVEHLGPGRAARLPMDHYFLDATLASHRDQSDMSVYQRDRIDWNLLLSHISQLESGSSIYTPRYDWDAFRRVPHDSAIGRSARIDPCEFLFVDGMHPSLDIYHKHVFVCTSRSVRDRLCLIRSEEMPVPEHYTDVLRQVEQSPFKESLAWLEENAWQKVENPTSLDVREFCHECGWSRPSNKALESSV